MRKIKDMVRLGEYLPDRHQIIIYYQAIEQDAMRSENPKTDYFALLSSVIAHEYFHAMHHARVPGHAIWNKSNQGKVKVHQKKEITEALADLFSVLWCYEKAEKDKELEYMDVAMKRFELWRKYLYSAWPYAKAIYHMQDRDGRLSMELNDEAIMEGKKEMYPLLEASLHDMARAYEYLRNK